MPIHLLSPDVAAKIAAGEVVERPANVAKELIENSLDAGATEIRVEIREGGQRLLRVIDNGHGMAAEEAHLALERHATSKLQSADDLNQIATFGFRGEALYSIAAVSHLTLTTRHRDEPFGVQLRVEGGTIVVNQRAGTPVGTIINVEHLFFNMPARKKFLRKASTEAGQISAVVQHCALAYPDRRFSFVNDGRLVFQSTGSGDLYDLLVKIYGLENAKQMSAVGNVALGFQLAAQGDRDDNAAIPIPIAEDALDLDVDFMLTETESTAAQSATPKAPSPIQVFGYASVPTLTRANRNNINLFINRRYVEDRNLTYAVVQAYHTLLPGGRYPMATIFVTIDPAQVDVNVHPQKVQVRFVDERAVFSAVQRAVRHAIINSAPIPDMALAESSGRATAAANGGWNNSDWASRGWAARRQQILSAGQRPLDLPSGPPTSARPSHYVEPLASPASIQNSPVATEESAASDRTETATDSSAVADPFAPAGSSASMGATPPSTTPPREMIVEEQTPKLPPLRVVGQVGAMYIIAEGPEGVFLIDQHAAHERILYEKYLAQRYGTDAGVVPQQHLLEPLTLHIGHELTGLLAQHLPQLAALGFTVEPFGGDTYLVRAIPSVLSGQDPLRALDEIANALATRRNLVGEELEARMVKMICKRASIKAGQLLSTLEMQELIHQLEACRSPRTCPHGRPTMIQLSAGELEKAFGRV